MAKKQTQTPDTPEESISLAKRYLDNAKQTLKSVEISEQIFDFADLRLSAHIILLPVRPEDRKYFSLNMEKQWDFNTVAVTDAYRLATIKPIYWESKTEVIYKVKFAIIGDAYSKYKVLIHEMLQGEEKSFRFTLKHGIEYNEVCYAGFL